MMEATITQPSVSSIDDAWIKHVQLEDPDREPVARKYLYASQRRKCLRRSVFEATRPEAVPPFEPETKAKFKRGKQRERDLNVGLIRVGQLCKPSFEIIAAQESISIKDRNGRLIISGKIDGRLKWENGSTWPYEIKSWSVYLTDRIYAFSDLYLNQWTWSGGHQLLSYLYGTGEPHGLLVLDRPGLPRLIEVDLEPYLEDIEGFLQDAEICVDYIENGSLPDYINDPKTCKACPFFGSICQPDLKYEGAKVIVDEELEAMLERREDLKTAAGEYKDLDSQVKTRLRGVEQAVAGSFLIEGRWQQRTAFDLPEGVEEQIKEFKAPYKVPNPQGAFRLKITKV